MSTPGPQPESGTGYIPTSPAGPPPAASHPVAPGWPYLPPAAAPTPTPMPIPAEAVTAAVESPAAAASPAPAPVLAPAAPSLQDPHSPQGPYSRGEAPAPRRGRHAAPNDPWGVPAWLIATVVALCVAALATGVIAAGLAAWLLANGRSESAQPPVSAPAASSDAPADRPGTGAPSVPAPGSIADVVEAVQPSVVQVNVSGGFQSGSGSGFIYREDGYILTNNHVVGTGRGIQVVLHDGTRLDATLVGANAGYDIAVLKVARTDLPALDLADVDALRVGDPVIAFGSPLGLTGTVTTGIVSALDRPVTTGGQGETAFISAVQTDAAINPGNSGGPLTDAAGRVVGINTAIASLGSIFGGQAGNIGVGFAIPADVASRIADEIITTGSSATPIIGVELAPQVQAGVQGAVIAGVTPDGPAAAAGLAPGDVVTAVDGTEVTDATSLVVAVRDNAPGDTITVTYQRDGQERTARVTLQAAPK